MKKFGYIENNEIKEVGILPNVWNNISNFPALEDDLEYLKSLGWLPIQTISDNKPIVENIEYIIEDNVIKEIITSRDKTQEEIEGENNQSIIDKWSTIRVIRNNLLRESDVEILPDKWEEMDLPNKTAWANYRKHLRNIPQTFLNPDDVVWPNKP
jgi:hypothetical protein